MKKVMLTVSAFALVAIMAACGGSAKSDAEALAKKSCECEQLGKDGKQEEAMKCATELMEMAQKDQAKYEKDSVATKEYEEAFKAAYEACNK